MATQNEPVHITLAGPRHIEMIQNLWAEYWNSLGMPPDLQNFEEERMSLPGKYQPPPGRLLIALSAHQGKAAGTAAFRRLDDTRCEAKRLYVRPEYRGCKIGSALLLMLVEEARAEGYREMYCDTLKSMQQALRLYQGHGFIEVDPYSPDPTPGAIFLKLVL